MAYFEAGLCLVSTYLGYRSITPPGQRSAKSAKQNLSSKRDIVNGLLYKTSLFWIVVPTMSGLAQTYYLLKHPELNIPWRGSFIAGLALITSGGLLRLWCYSALGKSFTFFLSASEGQKVIDSGPYAIVRHPSYLALLPYFLGSFFCFTGPLNILCTLLPTRALDLGILGNLHPFLAKPSVQQVVRAGLAAFSTLTTVVYYKLFVDRIPEEENLMVAKLGRDYTDYQDKVPYKLIPYIW